ncbi:hypothetical protein HPB52_022629 [Rhipicephalus sanguineus]|uniref:Doublecortin domain-containing protein n=1 Tax=Rhipicephalus sanguineus TaxID=34632 RepID=A0A9D4Q8M7_RHISA|nr:hypothetical protein HPB52_022629 [Rhipicephalus sanguineus]
MAASDEESNNHRIPRVALAEMPDSRWVYMYLNGDEHFEPLRTLVNQRHYRSLESLLEKLTERIRPSFGAIRSIYTPRYGHRVSSIDDLRTNERYVAAGYEKFRQLPHGRTYETLAQNSPGNPSQSAIAEAEDENEDSAADARGHSQETAIAMKEASTSTTEDKETATTMSLYNNQEMEDSAIQTGSLEEVRTEEDNRDAPPQDSLGESTVHHTALDESAAEPTNEKSDSNETLNHSSQSPEPVVSPPENPGPDGSTQPPVEDVSASVVADTASPATNEVVYDDPSEIAYATPLQDAKRLQDLEQHLHRMSGNSNHKLKTSPDRASKPEESDNISLASLNSFYEHEQQLQRAETEASKNTDRRSGSRHSAKLEYSETPKQHSSVTDSSANRETPATYAIEKNEEFNAETIAATESSGAQPQPTASTEEQLGSVQGSASVERPRPAARRKSSGSINVAAVSVLGSEPHATPNGSPMTQRSVRVSESRASVNSTSSVTRRDSLNEGVSRRERRSSLHSFTSLGLSPAETNGRVAGLSKQSSVDEVPRSNKSSEKRPSKTSRTSSQDRTQGTVAEKSALKNPSGSISHVSRKANNDSKASTHAKVSKSGTEKKPSATKSKRPAEEESNNKAWSRSSSVESLKSNKDSGYSPASERSKDSTEAPQRQRDVKDASKTPGSSSKRSENKLSSLYYATSPPHSPIRTYAYLLQEKNPAPSYDYRAPENGPTNQAVYNAAPLRYSSATKNQWKPDTYPILEEEDVFYAKSSRGKNMDAYREINLDEDSGGVFRARQFLSDAGGAVEIQESMDTKIDVPIDDMEALEVEEEYLPPEHIRIDRTASGGPGHRIVTFLPSAGSGRGGCATSSDKRTMTRHISRDDVQRMVI